RGELPWRQLVRHPGNRLAGELTADCAGHGVGERGRYGVPDLELDLASVATDDVRVRKALQTQQLRHPPPAGRPAQRPAVRTRLPMDRRRWASRIELEQERPGAGAPREERVRMARVRRVVQVVPARRDLGEQMAPLAVDGLFGLWIGREIRQRVAGR